MSIHKPSKKDFTLSLQRNNNITNLPSNLFSLEKDIQSSLENVRIIQKNLVYIVSLPKRFLDNEVISFFLFFRNFLQLMTILDNTEKLKN